MTEKQNTPEIRFEGFTDPWEQRKLGDITSSYSGGTPQANNPDYYNGSIPFIRSAEINADKTELYLTEKGLAESSAALVDAGCILYALYGATSGEAGISRINGAINQAILAIYPYAGFDSGFLASWLRREKDAIVATYLQGGQGNLSGAIVKDFKVPVPGLPEQKAIGDCLFSLDNLITLHQRKHDKLCTVKKSMLDKMFPKPGETEPEIRFKGFTDPWEQRKLGELCIISKGHGYSKADIRDAGTPLILYGRLYTQYKSRIENVDTFAVEQEGSLLSKGNEVIVPASGETAEDIAVASSVRRSGIIFGGDLNVVTPVSKLDPDYIALAITYSKAHDDLAKRAQGKSVVHVHGNDIAEVEIPYPSESEQKRISTVVLGLDSLITLHQRKLDLLKNTKKSLLDKMFV